MDTGRSFSTWRSFCVCVFSGERFHFLFLNSLIWFLPLFIPIFFKAETVSRAQLIIPRTMSSSVNNLLNPTSGTLRGRARCCPCGRAQSRGRDEGQSCQETQCTLLPTALKPITCMVNRSLVQKSVSLLWYCTNFANTSRSIIASSSNFLWS